MDSEVMYFRSLVVSVLMLPGKRCFVLSRSRLPRSLRGFRGNSIRRTLGLLAGSVRRILLRAVSRSRNVCTRRGFVPLLRRFIGGRAWDRCPRVVKSLDSVCVGGDS